MSVAGVSVHMEKMVYAWMADPAGLRPVSWCFYCFSHRESYIDCAKKGSAVGACIFEGSTRIFT